MATATFTIAQTKATTAYNAWLVTQAYTFTVTGDVSLAIANLPPSVQSAGLMYGSSHVVIMSGSAPTSIALLVGNDGILANLVPLGLAMTSGWPQIMDITSGVSSATTQAAAQTLSGLPFLFFNWQIIGAAAPSVITITTLLLGSRG